MTQPIGSLVTVGWDGSVSFNPEATTPTFCDLDPTYFPFDEQNCTYVVRISGDTADKVLMVPYEPATWRYTRLEDNEEWAIIRLTNNTFIECIGEEADKKCFSGVSKVISMYFAISEWARYNPVMSLIRRLP